MYKSVLARDWLSLSWMFSTPRWMLGDAGAKNLIYRLRILTAIWDIGILSTFLFLIRRYLTF